jgi:hypothetical protein
MVAGIGSVVMDLDVGFSSTSAIVIIQDSVGWAERGLATASDIFSRNLGSTLGAVLNASLAHRVNRVGTVTPDQLRQLLDRPGSVVGEAVVRAALGQSLHLTFRAVFLMAVLTLLATLVMQRRMAATAAFALVWPTSHRLVPIIQTYVTGPRRWRCPSAWLVLLLATLMSSVVVTKKAETVAAE